VAADGGHSHRGHRGAQARGRPYLSQLGGHLRLLAGVPGEAEAADLGHAVEGDGARQDRRGPGRQDRGAAGGREPGPGEGGGLAEQLGQGGFSGSGHGLVRSEADLAHADLAVEEAARDREAGHRAIRPGDQTGIFTQRRGIDLGDHERDFRVPAERGAVVDHPDAGAGETGPVSQGDFVGADQEHQVAGGQGGGVDAGRGDRPPAEAHGRAGAARREREEFPDRKPAPLQGLEQFAADHAGRADDPDPRKVTGGAHRGS
jgi:hypothetical protein